MGSLSVECQGPAVARSHDVVVKQVDYSPKVSEVLNVLGSRRIPTFLVFPAKPLEKPTVLTTASKGDVVSALRAVVTIE